MKQLDVQQYTGTPVFIDNVVAEGEASDQTPNTYIKICKNGIFRCSKNGMMESVVKIEGIPGGALNDGKDSAIWCGPKLSLEDFHFIKALFIKIYSMIKTECDVQLEYSQQLGKIVIRLPHQTVSGTHVSWETQDDDVFWVDRQRVELKDLPTDLEHIGRVHSHNVMGAFWSGTDTSDQEKQERGIQIVMGKITTEFEYKCRIANCGNFYDCEPHDVLDIPPVVMPEVPEGIIKVVTPAYTTTQWGAGYGGTTTQQHPAGYSSTTWFSGSVWDSKLRRYVLPAKANEGGTAENGGNFRKQDTGVAGGSSAWPGRYGYGYGDYDDYEGPSYNDQVTEGDKNPFDKGGHVRVIRVPKTASAKTESKQPKIITPSPSDKNKKPHPISYLISGLIAPEFAVLSSEEMLALAQGFDDPIETALNVHVGDAELRKILCFEAYHQALFAEPTDLSNMTPKETIDEFDAVFKLAQKSSSEMTVVENCLKGSALNLTHAVRCFRNWYPIMASEFASYLYQRFKISLNNVGNIVWSPKQAAVRTALDQQVGMLMDIEEACFDSGMMMLPYIITTQFSEKKDREDYLLRLIKVEAL